MLFKINNVLPSKNKDKIIKEINPIDAMKKFVVTMFILKSIQLDMWFFIIYSGLIVSIGAHMSLFYLYKFYPVGKVLPFYALFPVFGLIQTFIVFNEIPSLIMSLGGIIVVGSVFFIQKVK